MNNVIFVVEMLRNGTREEHSYVAGVYDNELDALKEAWSHMRFRADKYSAEIQGHPINGGCVVYKRKLCCYDWDGFAASSKELAEKVKEYLDKNE